MLNRFLDTLASNRPPVAILPAPFLSVGIVASLVLAACSIVPHHPHDNASFDWNRITPESERLPARDCPYVSVYLDRPQTSILDAPLAAQTVATLSLAMEREGFAIASDRSSAQFVLKSVAQQSFNRKAPNWIVWSLVIDGQLKLVDPPRLGGRSDSSVPDRNPLAVAYRSPGNTDAQAELVGDNLINLVVDMPLTELEGAAEYAAKRAAADLGPYIRRKCDDLKSGSPETAADLGRLRETLAGQIQQIRSERAREEQKKQLQLEVEPVPTD